MTPELVQAARRLIAIVARLRNDIDIHRIIGLNVDILKKSDLPAQFLGHAQANSLRMIVIGIRKAFDRPTQHSLHSVPGICSLLADPSLDPGEPRKISIATRFAEDWNLSCAGITSAEIAHSAHESFVTLHAADLERLRQLRNKDLAHADASYLPTMAASHHFYEEMFRYLRDFHHFLTEAFDAPTTLLPHSLGMELHRFLKKIDPSAKRDFDH